MIWFSPSWRAAVGEVRYERSQVFILQRFMCIYDGFDADLEPI